MLLRLSRTRVTVAAPPLGVKTAGRVGPCRTATDKLLPRPRYSTPATIRGRPSAFQASYRCRRPRATLRAWQVSPDGYRTIASALQFFDEFAHAAAGLRGPVELRDVPAIGDQLHRRPRDVSPEVFGAGRGQEPILRSPEDQHRRADGGEDVDAQRPVPVIA